MVKREMETAWPLDVPLLADVGSGRNWRDAK
jgi:DNA polymerase I-like protein with 3'-5' exonuclease and polymerase domains